MSTEGNKAVIRRFVEELWTAGKLEVTEEIVAPRTRNPNNTAMWENGPVSVAQWVADVRRTYPGLRRTIHDLVAEGDRVVLYSTYAADVPIGGLTEYTGVACFVLEDGKIVEEPWSVWPPR